MLFKQFRHKAKARKDRIRADRQVASRVMEDLDKKDKKSGFDWKSFLFGSKQKKQEVTEQCTQMVDKTKRELALLKEELNKEYEDAAERASKKAELLKELAALRARVIKREKMVQQIDFQQDARQEYLVAIKKQINELEDFLDSTEADIEQSKQAGPDGSLFFLVGKSPRDIQDMTELGSPEAIRKLKDKDSYEFIDYFVTGGVELNGQCAAAIQGTTTKLSDLATKQAGGPNLDKRKEVIAKILNVPFDPNVTVEAGVAGVAAMPPAAAAASKKRDWDDVGSCSSSVTTSSEEGGSRPPKMLKTGKN